jgi:hypothetical protein
MAASLAELQSELMSFPPSSHVRDVCKAGQGAAQCIYLSKADEQSEAADPDYRCGRASSHRQQIDHDLRIRRFTQTGNCSGTLGLLVDNQNLLTGNKTMHHEEFGDTPGVFNGIVVDNGIVLIEGLIALESLVQLDVKPDSIVFSAPHSRNTTTKTTVFFEKPQEPAA